MTKRFIVASEAPANQQWMFINQIAVISSDQPSVEFFNEVRRIQAEWCRRSKYLFPRHVRKSVKAWDPHEPNLTKKARYLRRCLCLTGLMLHAGAPIPDHEWRIVEAEAKAKAKEAALTAAMPPGEPQPNTSGTGRPKYPETVPIPPPPPVPALPANSAR